MLGEGAVGGLHLNVHQRDDGMIFGAATRKLRGIDRLREDVAGVSFLISPTAFFQTNVAAAELLVRLVLEAVPADVPVLDLYAGAGLFALTLAKRGHTVTAVEESREAVADGQASQRLNHIPEGRCRWIAAPVEASVKKLRAAGAVILDPPREGCAPGVLDRVFGERAPLMAVYVSCNPETLGRDLRAVVQHGYRVESVQPVDMFPHTPHIETVVLVALELILLSAPIGTSPLQSHHRPRVCGSSATEPVARSLHGSATQRNHCNRRTVPMQRSASTTLALGVLSVMWLGAGSAAAAPFGPSAATASDSPLAALDSAGGYSEGFRGPALDAQRRRTGGRLQSLSGRIPHSVDADDGSLDGGARRRQLVPHVSAADVAFTFNAGVLGCPADHAGSAWTDVHCFSR